MESNLKTVFYRQYSSIVGNFLDCVVGKEQWIGAKKILKPKGRIVTISQDEEGEVTIDSALKLALNISYRIISSLFGKRIKYIPVFLDASADLLNKVVELVQSGKVKPYIQKQYLFTMKDAHQIIADSKQRRMVGKSVIVVSEDAL